MSLSKNFERLIANLDASLPNYGREWGEWHEWDGSHMAGPDGVMEDANGDWIEPMVNVYRRSPLSDHWRVDEAHKFNWKHDGSGNDILAYRVEK